MHDIIKILNLVDDNIDITNVELDYNTKHVYITTNPEPHYCPRCDCRMHSNGVKERTIRHSILQDGYDLVLHLKQRRWICSNDDCRFNMSEKFNFVRKGKQTTNLTDLLIVEAFRNLNNSAAEIGRQFKVSDHHAMNIFDQYVHMKRLPLPEVLSVDEVYIGTDINCKYVLVLQDFATGNTIDLVRSRRKNDTQPYFVHIPKAERDNVKFVISDMYNPYIQYVNVYFHNAVSVVDSFHVMQWINKSIDKYLVKLLKEYKERDAKREMERLHVTYPPDNIPLSDEVYLLQNYRWIMLKNERNIDYSKPKKMNRRFRMMMDAYDYRKKFFNLDPKLERIHELKELYADFNFRNAGKPDSAKEEFNEIIDEYSKCEIPMFVEFSGLLLKYKEPIINSFIYYDKIGDDGTCKARLSNGPIESLNLKAKDMKRFARGYTNFDHLRNRFLFSTRKNSHISFK